MNNIKSKINKNNKHFIWGLSFFTFSLIASVCWGLIYAEDNLSTLRTSTSTDGGVYSSVGVKDSTSSPLIDENKEIVNSVDSSPSPVTSSNSGTTLNNIQNTTGTSPDIKSDSLIGDTERINSDSSIVSDQDVNSGATDSDIKSIVVPKSPTDLSLYGNVALTTSSTSISLWWKDNSSDEEMFMIDKKLSSDSTYVSDSLSTSQNIIYSVDENNLIIKRDLIDGVTYNTNSIYVKPDLTYYTDKNVKPGVLYDYRIKACLKNVCSDYSVLKGVSIPIAKTTDLPVKEDSNIDTLKEQIIEKDSSLEIAKSETSVSLPPKVMTVSTEKIVNKTITPDETSEMVNSDATQISKQEILETLNILSDSYNIGKKVNNQMKVEEKTVELIYKDTNKDGISDYDSKYIYNIDPIKASPVSIYEGEKINASQKILLGFDPSKSDLIKIDIEQPIDANVANITPVYRIKEVELTNGKEIVIKGQALPNSFITIYIYSTPIMVTVKTDSKGEWQYVLDKELEDGDHTIYTATVNNTGNILAKSSPYSFTKTAEAVTLKDLSTAEASTEIEKPSLLGTKNLFIFVIGILMVVGISLILIGLVSKKSEPI